MATPQPSVPGAYQLLLVPLDNPFAQRMEQLVSSITDLTTAVQSLLTVAPQLHQAVADLESTVQTLRSGQGGSQLSAADQAALDQAVSNVQSVTQVFAADAPAAESIANPPATPPPATT